MASEPMLSGAEAVCEVLAQHGVGTTFALGGASHTFLLDALERRGVGIVSTRHETGTVAAADGYSRVTGKLGVALIISDQGVPNAITGIATAFHACSPVLVLVARLPTASLEAEAEADHDKQALTESIVKWSRTVPSAERLPEYVDVAARRALTGRPGPTVLVIPQEFLQANLAAFHVPRPRTLPTLPGPSEAAVEAACDMLAEAQRPLIIVGAGGARSGAGPALRDLVAKFPMPVLGNGLGRGLVPEDDELSFSWPYGQFGAKEADLVLVLGARLKQRLGYGLPPRFSPQARWIQVDIAAEEQHRNRPIDLPIAADVGLTCGAIAAGLQARGIAPGWSGGWLKQALAGRDARLAELRQLPTAPVHPLDLGRAIMAELPANAIYVGDGAAIQNWMYATLRVRQAPGFMDHYPLGSMGIGTPLALGAAAGARELAAHNHGPQRPVVLVTGDGSFGFYIAELESFSSAGLAVVGNDRAWGTERHGQLKAIQRSVNTDLGEQRFELVAEGFGCRGERVEDLAGFQQRFKAALQDGGTTVFNVVLDREAGALLKSDPRLSMVIFNDLATGKELEAKA
jgi:acetolactate synthase-1/2/3 large subunit